MSDPKITSKNLQYTTTLPPFLQRLHANNSSLHGQDERHERPQARPKRARDSDAEDEPTYVDADGAQLSHDEVEKLKKEGERGGEDGGRISQDADARSPRVEEDATDQGGEQKEKGKEDTIATVGIGAARKRKVGRVVGVVAEMGEDGQLERDTGEDRDGGEARDLRAHTSEKGRAVLKQKKIQKAKKGKKIKLSFNDED